MDYKLAILFILSTVCVLGSAFLYFRGNNKSFSTIIISIFLLILGLIFFESFVLNYFGYNNSHPIIVFYSYMFFVLCLALPPTFYLYVCSLVNVEGDIFKNNKLQWHYGPAITLFIINIFSYISLYNINAESPNYTMIQTVLMYCNFISIFFIFLLQNIYYIASSWKLYYNQKMIVKGTQSKETSFSLNWMRWFIMLFTILIFSLYIFQLKPLLPGKFIFRVFTLFYVIVIVYFGSKNYQLLKEKKQSQDLDDDKRNELKELLINYMKGEKPHLNHDLTLNVLAHELGTNSKYLSYLINKEFSCNFSSFINSYRINEAKFYLKDPKKNIYTIESIAQMTGFKSKSAFNSAFKKETKLTPSKFKAQNIQNN